MRALIIVFAFVSGALVACASSDSDSEPAPSTGVGQSTPSPGGAPAKPAPPKDPAGNDACKLGAMGGVGAVTPAFVVYTPPSAVPSAMKGGALGGRYAVDGAKVFLPEGSGGLVDTTQSTGSMVAWAVFDGTRYHLRLQGDFTLSTVAGPKSEAVDVESQGGFVANGEVLELDHECDTAAPDGVDYAFTDDGSGHATIVVRMVTTYGDTWLQLEATKI